MTDITILHCTKGETEDAKIALDKVWYDESKVIHAIPGTRQLHYFWKVAPFAISCQTTSEDSSDIAEISFLPESQNA